MVGDLRMSYFKHWTSGVSKRLKYPIYNSLRYKYYQLKTIIKNKMGWIGKNQYRPFPLSNREYISDENQSESKKNTNQMGWNHLACGSRNRTYWRKFNPQLPNSFWWTYLANKWTLRAEKNWKGLAGTKLIGSTLKLRWFCDFFEK